MVDFSKKGPQTFKAYMSKVTIHGDRIEIKRGRLSKIVSDNRSSVIPLSEIVQVQYREPGVRMGCLFLATAEDHKTVTGAMHLDLTKMLAGNPHTIMLQDQRRFDELKAAVQRVLPEVPMVPLGG